MLFCQFWGRMCLLIIWYNSLVKIIGLSGTNGSGKDTVGHVLVERYNFLFVSVTEMLRKACRDRNLEVNRENLRTISAEWRREGGLGVLIDKAMDLFSDIKNDYDGLVVASLRNPGEADRVHELGGTVVWVDADSKIRYERIHNSHRGRDEEDNKTYEEFLAEEQAEMHASGDSATLDMAAVRDKSDVTILNEGTPTDLEATVKVALTL